MQIQLNKNNQVIALVDVICSDFMCINKTDAGS